MWEAVGTGTGASSENIGDCIMASSNFQKRFKDKVGVVLRSGEFSSDSIDSDCSPVASVSKAGTDSRSHTKQKSLASSVQTSSSKSPPKPFLPVQPSPSASFSTLPKLAHNSPFLPAIREKTFIVRKKSLGKLDNRSNSVLGGASGGKAHKSSLSIAETMTKTVDFHPYTMEDYKVIKKRSKGRLGGLGPVMVGREDWTKARDLRKKRLEYSQIIGAKRSMLG